MGAITQSRLLNNMMKEIQINSILPGRMPCEFFGQPGQFLNSVGIDPEMPVNDSKTRPSGFIRPTSMAKFSGTEITGAPLWMVTNNKDTNTYVAASDGKVHVVTSALAMGTALNGGAAITGYAGNGLNYYNNYLYLISNTDVMRYGPLNGTAALDNNWWTSDLSKTALSNTTYPSINGVAMPNHPGFVHTSNNRLYFGDVDANNQGCIHMIKTKKGTYEGDTDDTTVPSSYRVLDLYYGWYPTCLCSYNSMLAIGAIAGTDTTIEQQKAHLILWSTSASDTSYNLDIPLQDPIISAIKELNGTLYVFTGSASGGCRISRYAGGRTLEEIAYLDDCYPPLAGAVDAFLNRLAWGTSITDPITAGVVFSLGGTSDQMKLGVHNILKSTAATTTPMVTCLKYVAQGTRKQPIIGWKDNTGYLGAKVCGLDKISTTYVSGANILRTEVFRVGQTSTIKKIRIPLAQAISANTSFTVKLYKDDDFSTGTTVATVNNTNYSGKKYIDIYPDGEEVNNFFLEFTNTGTALCVIGLPITVFIEVVNDLK